MEPSDIHSIMRLFQGSPFPRTISIYATGGRQVSVCSIEEMFKLFEEAKFVDCRINAFAADNVNADFVMMDLDLSKFRTEKLLIKALDKTVTNIGNDFPGAVPTVLFTGGGSRVYQPLGSLITHRRSLYDMLPSDGQMERTMLVTNHP